MKNKPILVFVREKVKNRLTRIAREKNISLSAECEHRILASMNAPFFLAMVEYGYKQAEQGVNLQEALERASKVFAPSNDFKEHFKEDGERIL